MKKKVSLLLALTLVFSLIILPIPAGQAIGKYAVTFSGVSPDIGTPDMQEGVDRGSMTVVGWYNIQAYPVGQNYRLTFNSSSEPIMVVGISDIQNWSYNASTNQVTVNAKSISNWGLDRDRGQWVQMPNAMMVAVGSPADVGTRRGPPRSAKGMYISTTAENWDILPGDIDRRGRPTSIKIKLVGKPGASVWFKMYWPKALLDEMHLKPSTLKGFVDGREARTRVTPVGNGGALLRLNSSFPASTSSKKLSALRLRSRRIIATGKSTRSSSRRNISLNVSRRIIRRGQRIRLSGRIRYRNRSTKIVIFRKFFGRRRRFRKIAVTRTNRRGYFKIYRTPMSGARYVAVFRRGRRTYHSRVVRVRIRRNRHSRN